MRFWIFDFRFWIAAGAPPAGARCGGAAAGQSKIENRKSRKGWTAILVGVLVASGPGTVLPGLGARAAAPGPNLPPLMDRPIVEAIDKGLAYLAKVQQPDGSFLARWDSRSYPATMTGLSGLAFMAGGSTPEAGPYADQVKKAMIYLLELGEGHPDGQIAGPDEMRATYGHAFSMLFLAQCYGMEANTEYEGRIKRLLEKAIRLVARGQSSRGGWLYSPMGGGDEGSTTAGVLQALRACRNAGLKVPRETIDRAVGYLRYTQNPDGGICYSAAHRGASRPAISAAAVACFYATGIYDRDMGGEGAETVMVEKLWRYLSVATKNPEEIRGFYCYSHYYLAQAKYQRGGRDWELYYTQIARELLAMQAPDGSWPGDDVGQTYGTAIACFILQLPYGYVPICER